MLTLNDDIARSQCVTKIDAQVAPGCEGFENDAVSCLNEVACEQLKVMRRELFEIIIRHESTALTNNELRRAIAAPQAFAAQPRKT